VADLEWHVVNVRLFMVRSFTMSHPDSDMAEKLKDTAHTELQLGSTEGWPRSETNIDSIAEKRLVRKLDWILLPLSALACMSLKSFNLVCF
jgi:hypothetical protein